MNDLINKQTLFDNFSGKSTPLQKQMIEKWLGEADNLEYYYMCLNEWETENLQFLPNEQSAFYKIISVNQNYNQEKKQSFNQSLIYRFFSHKNIAVASVILMMVIGSLYFFGNSITTKTIHTAFGETQKVVLPDGSIVTLNSNSTLRYARFGFGAKNRLVHLTGEADFSIKHTFDNKQFLVNTDNDVTIAVLGTEFTAYARETSRVVLKSGKIELDYKENNVNKKLVMKPGDLFENASKKVSINHVDHPENFSSWKNHEFVFDNTSLYDIAKICKDNYDLTFVFESKELGERRISGSFHAENEDELLDAVSQLLDINYKYNKDRTIYFFD